MKRMAGNLAWPGDWCAGGSLEVLRGKGEDSPEVKQFRAAIQGAGGAGRFRRGSFVTMPPHSRLYGESL